MFQNPTEVPRYERRNLFLRSDFFRYDDKTSPLLLPILIGHHFTKDTQGHGESLLWLVTIIFYRKLTLCILL